MNTFKNILLAEDDLDDYNLFVESLEKVSTQIEVKRAANGLDCINILKSGEKPDIIFLDLNMPYKNGLDCLKFIRSNDDLAQTPVIIYSTSHYIKDIDTAYKNGANHYIVKPASGETLTEILSLAIARLSGNLEQPGKGDFVLRVLETT